MKKALAILAVLTVCFTVENLYAQAKPSKPRASEVVLVGRLQINPPLDTSFYSKYMYDEKQEKKQHDDLKSSMFLFYNNNKNESFGFLGKMGYVKISIPKNREIYLDYVRVHILDSQLLFFKLPIMKKIVIPENVNYVYIGSLMYSIENEFFLINKISLIDEFDEANAYVKETFGPSVDLVRVNLISTNNENF